VTDVAVRVLETVGIAPKGTTHVSQILCKAADALVDGGRRGIFTPMYTFVARKRADAAEAM
jgi:sterol 24-C-methyltransferase